MSGPPTKIQLGYLQNLYWWIESEAIKEPFWVDYRNGNARFHPQRYYSIDHYWLTVFSDLEALANAGYLYAFEIDDTNGYELSQTGREGGKWIRKSQ